MREAFRVEYLLMKDAQSLHSKSWDIPLRNVKTIKEIHSKSWYIPLQNVKTSKEIDEDLMVFR